MNGQQTIRRWMKIAATGAFIGLVYGCGGATNGLGPADSDDASVTSFEAAAAGPLDDAVASGDDGPYPIDEGPSPIDGAGSPLDVTTEAASDASVDVLQLCLTDAPVLNALSAMAGDPDADASACFGCIVTICSTELAACASDCTCNEAVLTFAGCSTDGGAPLSCALPLASSTDPPTAALAACAGGGLFGGSGAGCVLACADVSAADGSAAGH
jgi:hypothetical protein